jgi:basic membrane lipoprotein Med (substrate-binding protein (PBP1-ABC) superfamily)
MGFSRALRTAGAALTLTLSLAACGGAADETDKGTDTGAKKETKAAQEGPLKVAFLLPGSAKDRGYNADAQSSADLLEKELDAETTVTENVAVPNQADVYRQFAQQGNNVVIGWGGQFTDGAVAVASEFPDVNFIVMNSGAENGSNLASIDTNVEHWEFIRGFVAAKLSKSGTIAWVGSQCFPATAANLHGVEQGAKHANPSIKVLSTFTGDFEDPTKAQQGAQALIEKGADVLTGNMNNGWFGVYKAAQANGNLPVINEWIANSELAPEVIASSVLKGQGKFVVDVVKQVQDGSFEGKHYQFGITEDWGPAMAETDLLPADVFQEAQELQQQIVSGEVKPEHDETCPK